MPSRTLLACVVACALTASCNKKASLHNNSATAPSGFEDPDRSHDVPPSQVGFPNAAALDGVQVTVNYDNALLTVPAVAGAQDYRAFRLPAGTTLKLGAHGEETLNGTTIYCAGQQQHNLPAQSPPVVLDLLQVNDITVTTTIVVEAIDRLCPFIGVVGHTHADIQADADVLPPADLVTFSVFTEAEVRAAFGSLIVNGQAPGPTLAAPAAPNPPIALARTVLSIDPLPKAQTPTTAFFDFFDTDVTPSEIGAASAYGRTNDGAWYQTPNWNLYSYGGGYAEFAIERQALQMIISDYEQSVLASNIAVPRMAAQLDDTSFLHVTYEVASNVTDRRFWWLSMCGASTAGATFTPQTALQNAIVAAPFFDNSDGLNPSIANWNCLQIFPRDGYPFPLAPSNQRPETDIRVMTNVAGAASPNSVVNVSPHQYGDGPPFAPPSWYRQVDGSGNLASAMIDDQLMIATRTKFDVYVSRSRVVVYAAGTQRVCNDFPASKLTMAEAALGFGQVLFNSADERLERSDPSNDRTGQLYYTSNTPYIDQRSWDNIGFDEKVSLPSNFDATLCQTAQ